MLRINPTQMTEKECQLLDSMVHFLYEKKEFFANTIRPYEFLRYDEETTQTEKGEVKLTHNLIKRPCRPKGKHAGQFRYEVLAEEPYVGGGSYSRVYLTIGTFAPSINNQPAKYKIKERIYKFFPLTLENEEKDGVKFISELEDIQRECQLSPSYIGMREPLELDGGWCLFMRKIEGKELDPKNLPINEENSLDTRLSLSIELAEAVQRVHAEGIIHRDLKPENILVNYDETEKKWKAKVIDFGLSKKGNDPDKLELEDDSYTIGTPLYSAPDKRFKVNYSFKSDIYSLGCILSEVLGCNRNQLIKKWDDLHDEEDQGYINLKGLLDHLSNDKNFRRQAVYLLTNMTKFSKHSNSINQRPEAKEVVENLKKLSLFKRVEPILTNADIELDRPKSPRQ